MIKLKLYKEIISETFRGKRLGRVLQNINFENIKISGVGIDLGAKSNRASYYRYLKVSAGTKIKYTDLYPNSSDILRVDLEKHIPSKDDSQDFLILNNVLEHLFEYQVCANECYRILKKGGKLIGTVPFLHKVHHDPDDFFRYTNSSLVKIFSRAGFDDIVIKPLGCGPFSAAVSQCEGVIRIRILRVFFYVTSVFVDWALNKIFPKAVVLKAENYPLSFMFVCKK